MFFAFTSRKIGMMVTIVLLLVLTVFLTFEVKTDLYGQSRFSQIFTRLFNYGYQFASYSFRPEAQSARLSAVIYDQEAADSQKRPAHALPVLTYHAIIPFKESDVSPESFEGHNVGLKEFEDQMFTLKRAGYETITLEEFDAYMRGELSIPERSFLLTFDDGAKESFYPVDPVLKSLGYEAVTFILPKYSSGQGTYYYLSQNEIARALETGRWDIGSHGYDAHEFLETHPDGITGAPLANRLLQDSGRLETEDEYKKRVEQDLAISQQRLEEMFDRPVRTFAFPFGEFGQSISNVEDPTSFIESAAQHMYDYAFYQWWTGSGFTFNYPDDQSFLVRRISVRPTWTGEDLLRLLKNGTPKDIPYTDTFDADNGWLSTWGSFTIANGKLHMASDDESSGASIILDGTRHWRDYKIHLEMDSPNQTGVSVFTRVADNENNAICNLGNGFAHVEQMIDGERRVIKGNRSDAYAIPEGPFTIDVIVQDRTMSCAINGEIVVETTFLDPILASGGIGLKIWDHEIGKSVIYVDKMTVTDIE